MLRIRVEGDNELREGIRHLANSAGDDTIISDERGATGVEILQLVLLYGPPAVALLKQIIELIEAGNNVRKKWKVSIEGDGAS
ncbi:MAG: hypothetical protein IOC90_05465 [Methylocystis sp.]|nr:hypothetical protein [Methylocystis sp.]MCA3587467.1 hypothetical protein [Methylocystis sp.]MCA3591042.1 hypothetical protein [Methylocystis sp.]